MSDKGYAVRSVKQYDCLKVAASAYRIKSGITTSTTTSATPSLTSRTTATWASIQSAGSILRRKAAHRVQDRLVPRGKAAPDADNGMVRVQGRNYELRFEVTLLNRYLTGHEKLFRRGRHQFDITLDKRRGTPWSSRRRFPKIPRPFTTIAKPTHARQRPVLADGKEITFEPATAMGVLDWGRGVWTYDNTWYWSSASGRHEGVPFGFNLGYGFGETSAATENMLFYDDKAHKLGRVTFDIPQKDGQDDFLSTWTIRDDAGRLNLVFEPILDRAANMNYWLLASIQHQVFGRFSGKAVLDDGTELAIRDLIGFAEKVRNKW